jgi:hypothetical protein
VKANAIIDAGCTLCNYTGRRPDKVDFWMERGEKRNAEVRKELRFAYDISKADEFVIDHVSENSSEKPNVLSNSVT